MDNSATTYRPHPNEIKRAKQDFLNKTQFLLYEIARIMSLQTPSIIWNKTDNTMSYVYTDTARVKELRGQIEFTKTAVEEELQNGLYQSVYGVDY